MPEGHTIHRLAREHTALLAGQRLALSSPQGRFAAGAGVLDGHRLARVEPYGKHLFYRFDVDLRLHVHLGLYGSWRSGPLPPPPPRGAVRVRIVGESAYVELRGPTVCEVLTGAEQAAIKGRLGPDPLRTGARPAKAWERIRRSRAPIAGLLMDQSVIAGVGNVYRAELLYLHELDPFRPGNSLSEETFTALWADLRRRMLAGVRAGRIVTTRSTDRRRRRGPAAAEDSLYVYRRAGMACRRCGAPVRTEVLAGRHLYWCPLEQPPWPGSAAQPAG